jgi:hypothetical protein
MRGTDHDRLLLDVQQTLEHSSAAAHHPVDSGAG